MNTHNNYANTRGKTMNTASAHIDNKYRHIAFRDLPMSISFRTACAPMAKLKMKNRCSHIFDPGKIMKGKELYFTNGHFTFRIFSLPQIRIKSLIIIRFD